jgi:hypothetical protein
MKIRAEGKAFKPFEEVENMEQPKVEEKTSPKVGFVKGNFRSEILRKKSKEKESAFLPRMAKYGWEGLDKTQAHWKPESNEYHYGAKDGCDKCAPKTPPLQMNGTDQKTPEKKVPDDTKAVAPSNLSQKTNVQASAKDAPSSKPIEMKAQKSPSKPETLDLPDSVPSNQAGKIFGAKGAEDIKDHAQMLGYHYSYESDCWIRNKLPGKLDSNEQYGLQLSPKESDIKSKLKQKKKDPKKDVIDKPKVGTENVAATK